MPYEVSVEQRTNDEVQRILSNPDTTVDLQTWNDFLDAVKTETQTKLYLKTRSDKDYPSVLFRGHASSDWGLETTLERNAPHLRSVIEYYRVLTRSKVQLQAYTDRSWKVPSEDEFHRLVSEGEKWVNRLPALDYFVYLRHHGFPSPLLDWSRSAFVAAFFAFRTARADGGKVAIYCLNLLDRSVRAAENEDCLVRALGYNVRTHRRHFLQQAEYTISIEKADGVWSYQNHERVMLLGSNQRFKLKRFLLPAALKHEVLNFLDAFNLNAFTLFGSDDALVESVARREMGY